MQASTFWNQKILGIKRFELALLFLFYLSSALFYNLAIYLSSGRNQDWLLHVILDYGLKALFTLPIWWLMFRKLRQWKIWQKVLLHLLILPFFTFGWQQTYYAFCELTGLNHLAWPGSWWDIYIPALFYFVQFGIYHVYDFYTKLQKQREMEADLREIALQNELTALKSQLNPHFLYNIFNAISASLPPEQERTREMIAKLSDLFRYQLKSSKVDMVPLAEEIELVRKYLELEKFRFQDRLQFEFEIDKQIEEKLVPPMLIQPLVENAIKHGIAPKIDGGSILVKAFPRAGQINFEICDTGVGIQEKKQVMNQGIGLTNTQKRLEKMYQSSLTLVDTEQGGTCIKFQIPLV